MKKPVLIFTTADQNNFPYAVLMLNSLTKFHKPPEVDIILFTNETRKEQLARLPKGVEVKDVTPFLDDPAFWYRQKPILAEQFMDDYEVVLGMDADQLVVGSLDYIFTTKDYDIGTVINGNRVDPQFYGVVQFQGVHPMEYFNCGLVAMRSKKFVHDWKVLCYTPQFDRSQYREQDLLNAMCYYGNWNVRCFDYGDGPAKYFAWHGLIAKGELPRAILKGTDIVIPKGEGDSPFPPTDITLKVIHTGGGNMPNKLAYQGWFSDQKIVERIDALVKHE